MEENKINPEWLRFKSDNIKVFYNPTIGEWHYDIVYLHGDDINTSRLYDAVSEDGFLLVLNELIISQQQLQLKDKMIELMANTILAYSYRTKTIKQCKKIYEELAQQALAELEK